jgi:hypothetical protein
MVSEKVKFQTASKKVQGQGLGIPRNEAYIGYAAVTRDEA